MMARQNLQLENLKKKLKNAQNSFTKLLPYSAELSQKSWKNSLCVLWFCCWFYAIQTDCKWISNQVLFNSRNRLIQQRFVHTNTNCIKYTTEFDWELTFALIHFYICVFMCMQNSQNVDVWFCFVNRHRFVMCIQYTLYGCVHKSIHIRNLYVHTIRLSTHQVLDLRFMLNSTSPIFSLDFA